ncbi:MAG: insulinase family protein [Gemmatimonadetes bacterium]|nr:MAG: insulinase family protein [Gemmatimonadota bacterium]
MYTTARSRAVLGLAAFALAFALARPVHAQLDVEGATFVTHVEGIDEYRLDNGLRVLLFPDPGKPTATVNITYFVGSRHEAYGETGMAHLLEHLVFKGTPDHPDITQELTEHGARPNGTTWFDRTNYFETFPATDENLAWALDLEADRMVNSFIAKEDLDSEMTVVRNEMESGENDPFRMLMQRVMAAQYIWHNYGKSTIGARSDVENVPIERLQGFYRKYYQPDNAMLVVAGKFDPEPTLRLVVEKFGAIPRPDRTGANRIWPTYTREPVQDGERAVTLHRVGETKIAMMAYHVPPGSHEDFAPVEVLAQVLGDTPSGRLYKALVEPGLATSTGAFAFQLREAGPLLTFAQLRPEGDLTAVREAMDGALRDVLVSPVTGEEVDRARTSLLKGFEMTMRDPERLALQLSEWAAMGDWRLFFLHRDRLAEVQAEDVQRVALAYLKPDNRTVGLFDPVDEPDRAEIPDVPDIEALVRDYRGKTTVATGEAFEPTPDNIDRRTITFTLSNGMEVALLPKATRGQTVVARVRMQFGDLESLRGRTTAGSLAGSMLMRGTKHHTRQEIQDELDRLHASGGVGGGATQASGSVETTREYLPDVLRLIAEIAREPAFPEEEFAQLKEQQLASLESQKTEPQPLAIIALQRTMNPLPEDHPNYVPTIDESIQRVSATTLDDVKAFYESFYGPQSGNITVVGDFDPDEVRAVLEEAFGDWQSPHPYERIANEFRDVPAEHIVIETPDKANAFFVAQQNLRLRDSDPDYPALALAGYMIGGGFLNSRLARRIRQQDGLSYGVGGAIQGHPIDESGAFIAFAIYAPENAEKLEAAFKEEVQKVIDEGFTPEEVEAAKQGWLQQQQLQRAQDGALAGMLSSNLYFDRTMAWSAELEAKVAALTPEQILDAVRRHLDVSKITIVRAGDFAGAKKKAAVP